MACIRTSRGARARRLLACSLTLALASALGAPAAAQVVTIGRVQYEQRPLVPLECKQGGRWIGPIDFEQTLNPELDLRNPTYNDRDWAEMTHGILLPPPSDAPSMPSQRVLLAPRRFDIGSQANPGGD